MNVKHCVKFAFANTIAKVFIFLGKLALTVGNVFSMVCIMKKLSPDVTGWSPVVIVGIFSYITASIFFGIFETAVMALMTCLAVDMDLHGDTPKWGPPTFHDSLEKVGDDGSGKGNRGGDDDEKKANEVA